MIQLVFTEVCFSTTDSTLSQQTKYLITAKYNGGGFIPGDDATAGSILGTFKSSTLPDLRSKLFGRSARRRSWNITVPVQLPQPRIDHTEKLHCTRRSWNITVPAQLPQPRIDHTEKLHCTRRSWNITVPAQLPQPRIDHTEKLHCTRRSWNITVPAQLPQPRTDHTEKLHCTCHLEHCELKHL